MNTGAAFKLGPTHPCWKGGRLIKRGYVMVWTQKATYEYEHRIVAAKILGRPLLDSEVVHHINGDKTDNRPENLEVTIQSVHAREHMTPDIARAKALMAPKKTHCIRGHEFTPENTYRDGKGRRRCIACVRKYRKEWGAVNGR